MIVPEQRSLPTCSLQTLWLFLAAFSTTLPCVMSALRLNDISAKISDDELDKVLPVDQPALEEEEDDTV